MAISTYPPIITLSINKINAPIKRHRWQNEFFKKIPVYAAYKRPTSDLGTHTDWKWGDGKSYSV